MKTKKLLFLFVAILLQWNAQAQWKLIWSDEFNSGTSINTNFWKHETGPNNSNGELQYYTDNSKNSSVKEGFLFLEVVKETYGGKNYTSSRINSKKGWTYGKFEIRARLTQGDALWPAIWMFPDSEIYGSWPKSGEIDIMEHWSWDPNGIFGTIHTEAFNHVIHTEKQGRTDGNNLSQDFHIYGMEWYQDQIKWFVDGVCFYTFYKQEGTKYFPFDHPFHFILNVAVESTAPGKEGTWSKKNMEIDYVRVYEGNLIGPERVFNTVAGKIEAENFVNSKGVRNENCAEGGKNVAYIDPDDYIEYDIDVKESGIYDMSYRVATPSSNNKMEVYTKEQLLSSLSIPKTNGWQNWETINTTGYLEKGKQTLKIVSKGSFNINWIDLKSTTLGVEQDFKQESTTIYPNPVSDILNINVPISEKIQISIYTINGSKMASFIIQDANNRSINISNFASGVYVLVASSPNHQMLIQKFIKL